MVSVRTLQELFRRHLDTTPTDHLRAIRLDRAHRELRAADPESTTVGAVAGRWGFTHTGRFAATYRTRYGASPSETLRGRPRMSDHTVRASRPGPRAGRIDPA
jgi:transcriptional regulator GlxA family with amidase domain